MDADLWKEMPHARIDMEKKRTWACSFIRPSDGTSHKTKRVACFNINKCTVCQIRIVRTVKEYGSAPMCDYEDLQVKNMKSKVRETASFKDAKRDFGDLQCLAMMTHL